MKYEEINHKIKSLWTQSNNSENIIERLIKVVKNPKNLFKNFKSIISLHDSNWTAMEVIDFQGDSVSIASQNIGTKTFSEMSYGL